MDAVEPYVPPTKIPRPKFAGKHKSETNFQKFSNTYPTIVDHEVVFIEFGLVYFVHVCTYLT